MPSAFTEWVLLDGLGRDRARLIYSRLREMYFLHPAGRWFTPAAVAPVLEAGYLALRGLTPGVYGLSESGRARRRELPDAPEAEGACDGCDQVRPVRPSRSGEGYEFLCAACRERGAARVEEVYGIQASLTAA